MRTNPSTENTTIHHREKNDKYNACNHTNCKNLEIGGEEWITENIKFSTYDIKFKQWIAIDFDKRSND